MIRALIAILAGLPMLLPTGLCVCHVGRDASAQSSSPSTAAKSRDCCCAHRHKDQVVSTAACQSSHQLKQSLSGQQRHDHDRECPAVLATMPNKAVPHSSSLMLDANPVVAFDLAVVSHSQALQKYKSVDSGASPPIILMHCTLLL